MTALPALAKSGRAIGIGTWGWFDKAVWGAGGNREPRDVRGIVARARERGVRLFDTSPWYGNGSSEEALGRHLNDLEGADGDEATHKRALVATKFLPLPVHVCRGDLSASLRASRQRLGRDVDLFQLHGDALSVRSLDVWTDELARCVDQSLCSSLGLSNMGLEKLRRVHLRLQQECGLCIATNQIEFSLLRPSPWTSGLLEGCRELEVVPLAYSPLALGVLLGPLNDLKQRRALVSSSDEDILRIRAVVEAIASKKGCLPAQVRPSSLFVFW
jgi:aryl-alcohol dehydrogenase-like predicted oxidoreductase